MRVNWILVCSVWLIAACDVFFTELPPDGDDFASPFDGLTPELLKEFSAGDENFDRGFTPSEGLGPIFNNVSCASCHPGDGRGSVEQTLVRFSRGSDLMREFGGPQLQDRAVPGVQPEQSFVLPVDTQFSTRLPPPVFGVGLIEAITEETLLDHADPDDANGDGISGRPNMIEAPDFVPATEVGGGPGLHIGRFGHKANVASLVHQVAGAYQQDMGITSDFIPEEPTHPQSGALSTGDVAPEPEISALTVLQTVLYVRLLKPPARGVITPQVTRGETLFGQMGCAKCHVPSMTTGPSLIPQLSQFEAQLYSDLLIHDMGDGLADHRPDGQASGSEWRTAPLWGLRLVPEFLNGKPAYLHDGRAGNLHDAILWHGGEADGARLAYEALDASQKESVLAFLESL